MVLLTAQSVVKKFGGVIANDHVNLSIGDQEIVGLIGPNGAGKTTFFNCIAGYHTPDEGRIEFLGRDITSWAPHTTNKAGIARTFQTVKTMEGLTVEENVMIGALSHTSDPTMARREASSILELIGLSEVAGAFPSELPIVTQRQMELARALATKPRLLMLDECAAGLSPEEIEEFSELLRRIHRERRLALLVIEHVMEFVMSLSDKVVVLAGGRNIAEGTPDEVVHDSHVIDVYLGEKYA